MAKGRTRWKFHIFLRNIFILSVIVFIGYTIYRNISIAKTDTYQVAFTNVSLTSEHAALIFRNEQLVTTALSGHFSPAVVDGERVKKNQTIGTLTVKEQVELPSADGENDQLVNLVTEQSLNEEIDLLYRRLTEQLQEKSYVVAKRIKGDLSLKLARLERLVDAQSDSAYSNIVDKSHIVDDQAAQVGQQIEVLSSQAGVVTYFIDGYESLLRYENRYKIDYSSLFELAITPRNQTQNDIASHSPIFKIIDQFVWHIACQIKRSDIDNFTVGDEVLITIRNEDIKGVVNDVFDSGDSGILMVEMQQQPLDFQKYRMADVKIKRSEVRGIFVPEKAIVSKGTSIGVYQIDENHQLIFTPVKQLAIAEGGIIVQEGSFYKEEGENSLQVFTIKHGDIIVNQAAQYKEGDVVE